MHSTYDEVTRKRCLAEGSAPRRRERGGVSIAVFVNLLLAAGAGAWAGAGCGSSSPTAPPAGKSGGAGGGGPAASTGGGGPAGSATGGASVPAGSGGAAATDAGGRGGSGPGVGGAVAGGSGGGAGRSAMQSGAGTSGAAGAAGNVGVGGRADTGAGAGGAQALRPGAWGDQGDGTFRNPLLWADYNNLDVTMAGGEFFMIAASHHFMGIPVLRSRDMVNWTLIARIYRRLGLAPRYDSPGQAYQHGTWAPAIRYHEGRFWVFGTTPVEGLIMTSAVDAAGPWDPWTVVSGVPDLEDPCPFWDDLPNVGGDGPNGEKAYLVRSQLRAGPIIIQQMSWDGKRLLGATTTVATGPTLEGPKLQKRNGEYFIFAPEGGIDTGYQVVLRSRSILGPYEKRTILERGSTATNGPHQGSWIDLPGGQSWFYHFQQNAGWGRVAHLEPARWGTDGWPSIGVDLDGNGVGEPVARPRKPDVGTAAASQPLSVPASTDEFDTDALGLQWLWNHNPDNARWSLSARPGWLRLSARPLSPQGGVNGADGGAVRFVEDSIVFAYNTLVQLAMGQVSSAITRLDTTGMADGQRAGITLFGQTYGWIGVLGGPAGRRTVETNINGTYTVGPALTAPTVFLRASISANSQISFAYSIDGAAYTPLGGSITVGRTWFEGIKYGLFTYNLSTAVAAGAADFDHFRYTHDGPH